MGVHQFVAGPEVATMKLLSCCLGLCALLLSGSVLVSAYVPEVPKECVIILHGTHNWLMMNVGEYLMHRPVYQQIRDDGAFGTGSLMVTDTEFRWYMYANDVLTGTSHAVVDADSSCPAGVVPLRMNGVETHWFFAAKPESMCVPQNQYVKTNGVTYATDGRTFSQCMVDAANDIPGSIVAQWSHSTKRCEMPTGAVTDIVSVGVSSNRGCMRNKAVLVPGIGEPRGGYRTQSVYGVCHGMNNYVFHTAEHKHVATFDTFERCAVYIAEQHAGHTHVQYDKNSGKCYARKGAIKSEEAAGHLISCDLSICDDSATMFEGGTFEVLHATDNWGECKMLVSGMRIDAVGAQWAADTKECRAIFGTTNQVASTSWRSCPLPGCDPLGIWYKAPAVKPAVEPRVHIDAAPGLSFADCSQKVGQAYPWASVIDKDAAGECRAYFGQDFTTGSDATHQSCRTHLVRRRGAVKYDERASKEHNMGAGTDLNDCISKAEQQYPDAMGVTFEKPTKNCFAVPQMAYADATSYQTRVSYQSAFLRPKPMSTA